jgi:hypothetical protein
MSKYSANVFPRYQLTAKYDHTPAAISSRIMRILISGF